MEGHSRAQEIFAQFLARRDAGEALELDAFCAAHRELEDELRALFARWSAFEPRYERLQAAPAERAAARRAREAIARLAARGRAGARFERGAEVGRGGMGRVYRAFDPDLERELALKIARDDGLDPEKARRRAERFLAEARITGRLQHPGIVPIHELGLDAEGRVFYTMPLIAGEDLESVYARLHADDGTQRGEWSVARALDVLLRVCETMAYAHAQGVVHGDLKPSNVRIGRFGEVYVMDWGLARLAGDERPADDEDGVLESGDELLTRVLGTPGYLAPEHAGATARRADARTDVYALGAMLYRLLTGALPRGSALAGVRDLASLRAALAHPIVPLERAAPRVAPELASICARALADEPARRYPAMDALARDLRAFLEGRVVRAHATGPLVELRKWIGRNRTAAAALLGVVASLAVGLVVSHALFVRARDNAAAAASERDRVLRLSDQKRLLDLAAEAEGLWPPLPERVGAYDAWLAAADGLASRLATHRATLEALRAGAATDGAGRFVLADTEAQWHHDTLSELVDALAAFAQPTTGLRADVARRRTFASTVAERTLESDDARRRWDEARRLLESGEASPLYGALELAPQLGLVPLGIDPGSRLLELAHLQSGEVPARGADGRLALGPESAIVLVLIPGGAFLMGAQAEDPTLCCFDREAFENESPPHEVTLAPFFLAKHELTQGQWLRASGANPSTFAAGAEAGESTATLLHPVETVSRGDCERVLARLALALPTEAQWEYAARGGTETPWWTGAEARSLQGAANLADRAVERAGGQWPQIERWLDDGYYRHGPVDLLRPNPFGLHGVHGNVWEWCADDFGAYALPERAGDGLRADAPPGLAVGRGGGFVNNAAYCRVSLRDARPDAPHALFGLRPARALER